MHLHAELFFLFFGDDLDFLKGSVKNYLMAPMLPLNSPFLFLSSHLKSMVERSWLVNESLYESRTGTEVSERSWLVNESLYEFSWGFQNRLQDSKRYQRPGLYLDGCNMHL
jgi:hypothetical protein